MKTKPQRHVKCRLSKEEQTKIIKRFIQGNPDLIFSWLKISNLQRKKQ